MRNLLLTLVLLALPVTAVAAVPSAEVKTQVGRQVHQVEVYAQARAQLLKDRAAQQQKAADLSSKVAQAKRNRGVLDDAALKEQLRDALEASRALEATDRKLARLDGMMRDSLAQGHAGLAYAGGDLSKADRRALEAELNRVASLVPREEAALPGDLDIRITPGMDAEAIQERADLAGDYEDKLRKEATRAELRMRELEAQASMAGEAQNLAQDRRLFDEEDRVQRASRVVGRTPVTSPSTTVADDGTGRTSTGGTQNPTPPGGGGNSPSPGVGGATGNFTDTTAESHAGGAPATPRTDTALPRSQTVVDQRTFTLLRESRSPVAGGSPADELRQLQQRREALLRQAARLKAMREELNARARESRPATR
jgi:hypothetical protein